MNNNGAVIAALFAELDALGIDGFCIAAGARNAPIIAALMTRPSLTIRHFFDERSAAFFALGRVMQTRKPVAVLTTSGTAVAELFPAVMEAHYQNAALVVVTADRPSHYRGSGAPQSVEQSGIFGLYARQTVEIEAEHVVRSSINHDSQGVTHINICLEEGLANFTHAESGKKTISARSADIPVLDAHQKIWAGFWNEDSPLIVLASGIHPDDVATARDFLLRLQAPIVAEATSNLRDDAALAPLLIQGGERALASLQPKRVLRIGAVPSWRWWRDLEARDELRVMSISRAPFRGLARSHNVSVVPWEMMQKSEVRSQKTGFSETIPLPDTLAGLLDSFPNSETAWMRHVSKIIPAQSTVFLGNSLPVREWNLAAETPKPGTRFFANRGANGIDGLVSTWLGVSANAGESWLIVGDLSALYDLSAPWILKQLKKARRRIVVINNGGGKIFSRVGWLGALDDEVRGVIENRHALSFESWAQMWGLDYKLITDWKQLGDDASDTAVWEIRPDAAATDSFWKSWQAV